MTIQIHPDARIGVAEINDSRAAFSFLVLSDYTSEGEYNKTDWNNGDLITEALMDKIENVIYDNRHDINIIKKALSSLETPPTYVAPTATLTASPNLIEQGKPTVITLQYTYTKNDGGVVSTVEYLIGSTAITSPYTIDKTTQFTMNLTYTDGPIKETNLGNPYPDTSIKAGTLSRNATVTAIGMSYYGVGEATNATLKNSRSFTWNNITCEKDILVYKYPKSLGALSSIKDANNFDYINSYTRTEETINDIAYYVYTLTDPMTITGFKQIYA